MMRGPKPQSTDLKILRGNPGKRRLNLQEPQYPAGTPTKPTWLDEYAGEEWDRLVRVMSEARLLTTADFGILLSTVLAYSQLKRNELALQKFKSDSYVVKDRRGNRAMKPRPEILRAEVVRKQYTSFLCELGQSPVSKSRVKAIPANTEDPGLKEADSSDRARGSLTHLQRPQSEQYSEPSRLNRLPGAPRICDRIEARPLGMGGVWPSRAKPHRTLHPSPH